MGSYRIFIPPFPAQRKNSIRGVKPRPALRFWWPKGRSHTRTSVVPGPQSRKKL
ncbi:hypothetical protein GBA52_026638 [Prunus armeniaca]|nr:hypothetical protein GBA52_026638 [Prunus armeniaca]